MLRVIGWLLLILVVMHVAGVVFGISALAIVAIIIIDAIGIVEALLKN